MTGKTQALCESGVTFSAIELRMWNCYLQRWMSTTDSTKESDDQESWWVTNHQMTFEQVLWIFQEVPQGSVLGLLLFRTSVTFTYLLMTHWFTGNYVSTANVGWQRSVHLMSVNFSISAKDFLWLGALSNKINLMILFNIFILRYRYFLYQLHFSRLHFSWFIIY